MLYFFAHAQTLDRGVKKKPLLFCLQAIELPVEKFRLVVYGHRAMDSLETLPTKKGKARLPRQDFDQLLVRA